MKKAQLQKSNQALRLDTSDSTTLRACIFEPKDVIGKRMQEQRRRHQKLASDAAKRMVTTTRPKQTAHTVCKHLIASIGNAKSITRPNGNGGVQNEI
jgi:NADP-dependent 3-hydroxy acid dehydrogenase YdfG